MGYYVTQVGRASTLLKQHQEALLTGDEFTAERTRQELTAHCNQSVADLERFRREAHAARERDKRLEEDVRRHLQALATMKKLPPPRLNHQNDWWPYLGAAIEAWVLFVRFFG